MKLKLTILITLVLNIFLISCQKQIENIPETNSTIIPVETHVLEPATLETHKTDTTFAEENSALAEQKQKITSNTFMTFMPELNDLTGVFYHEETDTTIQVEMFTSPGARAINEYFITIHTKTDDGQDIVFQDVPAYYFSDNISDGGIVISLDPYFSSYSGLLLLEYERADQIYYSLSSNIDGCIDTENSSCSVQNITQATDLPQYTTYIENEISARELILKTYSGTEFIDLMHTYMYPEQVQEALQILYENSWYRWGDNNATWSLYRNFIHYQIVAAYNFDDISYDIYYYDHYSPGQLCRVSISLQYGDPWRPIYVTEPDENGTLTVSEYFSMSSEDIEHYQLENRIPIPNFSEAINSLDTASEQTSQPDPGSITTYDDISTYQLYDIGTFHNGIARFEISSPYYVTWKDITYANGKYGYINTSGEIVIPPIYTQAPSEFRLPLLVEYQVIKNDTLVTCHAYHSLDANEIINLTDAMLHMGSSSNDTFWIVTESATLSGNIPTITYYDTSGNKLFEIENAEYMDKGNYPGRLIYDSDSNFNEYGYAIIRKDGIPQVINKNGQILNFTLSSNLKHDIQIEYDKNSVLTITNFLSCGPNILLAIGGIYDSGGNWVGSRDLFVDMKNMTISHWNSNINIHDSIVYGDYIITYDNSNLFNTTIYYQNMDTKLWSFKDISEFSSATISNVYRPGEDWIVVRLKNKDGVEFSSIVDINGNILSEPQSHLLVIQAFSEGVCMASLADSDGIGFVNKNLEWVISPSQMPGIPIMAFKEGLSQTMTFKNGDTIISVINMNADVLLSFMVE